MKFFTLELKYLITPFMLSKRCFLYFRISIFKWIFSSKIYSTITNSTFIVFNQIHYSTKSLKINQKTEEVSYNIQNVCTFVL